MKKIFTLAVALCTAISLAFAGTATFTAEVVGEQGTVSTGSLVEKTVNGVTLSIDLGVSSVNPTYDVNWIRAYANATVTLSSESNITKIEFSTVEPSSGKYAADCLTTTTGNYTVSSTSTLGTWTGSANSVAFTATKQVRFITITVTTDGEGGGDEPITPAEAIEFEYDGIGEIDYYGLEENGLHNWTLGLLKTDEEYNITALMSLDLYTETENRIEGNYAAANGNLSYFYFSNVILEDGSKYYFDEETLSLTYLGEANAYKVYNVNFRGVGYTQEQLIADADGYFVGFSGEGQVFTITNKQTIIYAVDVETEETFDLTDAVELVEAQGISIVNGTVLIDEAQAVQVYNVSGQLLYMSTKTNEINGLPQGQTIIIRANNQTVKVKL